jgi:hypothetical protein
MSKLFKAVYEIQVMTFKYIWDKKNLKMKDFKEFLPFSKIIENKV